jgi:MoaA/NifB/PqqE/SkfB family radical SAM enzyme
LKQKDGRFTLLLLYILLVYNKVLMAEQSYVVKRASNQVLRGDALLSHIDIELTERCNNACIHCYINQPEHADSVRAHEMPTALIKEVLQQAAALGCQTVRFTGGEPLLREDFSDIYLFARRLGMHVILMTNARLITPELSQLFSHIPPGKDIEVTVYGMHPESYDTVAVSPGAFNEFWRGVELLRQHNIPFIVKQSLLPPNRMEIAEFEDFAATLPRMHEKPVYTLNFDLRARNDNPAKNRFIKTLRLTAAETVEKLASTPNYRQGMRQFAWKFMKAPGDLLFDCGAGLGTCVDAYGYAQMCMQLRHPDTVYDLHTETEPTPPGLPEKKQKNSPLRSALTEFFPRVREMHSTNPEYLARCARCFIKGLCEQCPAKSWMEHGTLDTPVEYLCEVAHAQAHRLGLLSADEHSWEISSSESQARVSRFVNAIE